MAWRPPTMRWVSQATGGHERDDEARRERTDGEADLHLRVVRA